MLKSYFLIISFIFGLVGTFHGSQLSAQEVTREWVEKNYTKTEAMIPMRDGVKLYTAIYEPVAPKVKPPVLILRTPYRADPYGKEMNSILWRNWREYARKGYVCVLQDVRGRWKSGGTFVNVTPFIVNKKKKTDIDEASDTYDTVEWLLHHLKRTNGRVGLIGSSYSGFYAWMGALSGHPAVKAVVPQAPVSDWFMGDDYHKNGALMMADAFRFTPFMNRPHKNLGDYEAPTKPYYQTDEYSFFLKEGTLENLTKLLGDSIGFWNDVMNHPDYDSWWQDRVSYKYCKNVKPAVMVVGGTFDAEDCYGAWNLYKTIKRESPKTPLYLAVGPWHHGAWDGEDGSYLGNIRFGKSNVPHYHKDMEQPFFAKYLEGVNEDETDRFPAEVFFSGSNEWKSFEAWPPKKATPITFYLREGGKLSIQQPAGKESFTSYVSDPQHPVPYTAETVWGRRNEYMTEDQRFAERRPDVLSFKSEPLDEDMTLAGSVDVSLKTSVSTTDADFVVKVIDVFPDDFKYNDEIDGRGNGSDYIMNGYMMPVRCDVMRGRYRNSFTKPQPFTPGKIETVHFTMNDIAHTFKKGHRIAVQIQSSWFPLIDRNPQQFVDIYHCKESDFVPSTIRIYHEDDAQSKITILRLPDEK